MLEHKLSDQLLQFLEYMCDELDAEAPKYGKRIGNAFTIGSELTFICSSNYNLKGEKKLKCLPSGEWSAEPPTCHRKYVANID